MSSRSHTLDRSIIIFWITLIISSIVLAAGNEAIKYYYRRKMTAYAVASMRESDGAVNLVILDGRPWRIGSSSIHLKYLKDGYVKVEGTNNHKSGQWNQIAEFDLDPGTYTFTGMTNSSLEVVALRLSLKNPSGAITNYWQCDKNVVFSIEEPCEAKLHIRVYSGATVNIICRPAVYKDE